MQHGHTEQAYLLYKSAMYSRHVERVLFLFLSLFLSFFLPPFSFLLFFLLFFFLLPRFIGHLIKQELLICDSGSSFHECENPHFNPRSTTRSSVALTLYREYRCIRYIKNNNHVHMCINNDNSPPPFRVHHRLLDCDVSFEYPPASKLSTSFLPSLPLWSLIKS